MADVADTAMTEVAADELRLAARSGDTDEVNRILSTHTAKQELLSAQDDLSGNSALHLCSANGHVDIAKLLLSSGASPDMKNKSGSTALHYACMTGQVEVSRALLAYGANAFAENDFNKSVMDEALSGRHNSMVDFLRRYIESKQQRSKRKENEKNDENDDENDIKDQNEDELIIDDDNDKDQDDI